MLTADPECTFATSSPSSSFSHSIDDGSPGERSEKADEISRPLSRENLVTFFCGNALQCRKLGDVTALRLAQENVMRHFPVVGILEDFNATLALFEKILPGFFAGVFRLGEFGAQNGKVDAPKINANPHANIGEAARQKLERELKVELDFHSFLVQRFQRQKRQYHVGS